MHAMLRMCAVRKAKHPTFWCANTYGLDIIISRCGFLWICFTHKKLCTPAFIAIGQEDQIRVLAIEVGVCARDELLVDDATPRPSTIGMRLKEVALVVAIKTKARVDAFCGLFTTSFSHQRCRTIPDWSIDRLADYPIEVVVVAHLCSNDTGESS